MTPNEYRAKHKRCTTCVYFDKKDIGYKYGDCKAKQKRTRSNSGRFCQIYKAKEF